MALRHERRRPRAMRGVRGVCPPVKALKAGKAPDRKRAQNGSCGQNNFASEDQRFELKEERLSRSAFSFFTAGSRPIGPVQFLYLRLALQHGIALRVKRLQIEHITQRVN